MSSFHLQQTQSIKISCLERTDETVSDPILTTDELFEVATVLFHNHPSSTHSTSADIHVKNMRQMAAWQKCTRLMHPCNVIRSLDEVKISL